MNFTTDITSKDGFVLPAYVALPDRKPKGSIVVLQEIFGVNSHIRNVVDQFAKAGYLAVAPATFHRIKTGVELGYTAEDMAAGVALKAAVEAQKSPDNNPITPLVMLDIQATIHYANTAARMSTMDTVLSSGNPAKGGKVGVVGYCWGGLLTWRVAAQLRGVAAAVPYYGGGMTRELEHAPRCPTMAHLSDNDQSVPMDGVAALQKAHPGVQVHIYSAAHGFNCDQRGAYQEAAALQARERTLEFFGVHLA